MMEYKGAIIPIPTKIGVQEQRKGIATGNKLALKIDGEWYHAERYLSGPDRYWRLSAIERDAAPALYKDVMAVKRQPCFDHQLY
jgi:hypothetical protein